MVGERVRLAEAWSAVLDIRKLEDYCLDPSHPRGRHKARVFRQALGLGRDDAAWLREVLLRGVQDGWATGLGSDKYGSGWSVDVPVGRQGRTGVVRTVWIVRAGETFPRFVTCWVL
jgi:hypothetical protein